MMRHQWWGIIRGQEATGPPLGSPEAALNMQTLLRELDQLNDQADNLMEPEQFDQWWAVTQRRIQVIRLLDAD